MHIYKFKSENWDDLGTAVMKEVVSPARKLGLCGTHFQRCLAGKLKRAEEPQKETIHRISQGVWRHGWSVITLVLFIFAQSYMATAGAPGDQLKQSVERIQTILSDSNLKGEAKTQERRQKLKEVINARFDFGDMAKRSLGPEWQKRSPEEQKEFVRSFTALLEGAYFDKLESYNGEKVRYVNERQDKDFAEVATKITNDKGEDFSLNYRLHDVNGDWKVFDIIIENISLVNNFRSQFNRVLAKSSYADLIQTMNQKKISAPAAKN